MADPAHPASAASGASASAGPAAPQPIGQASATPGVITHAPPLSGPHPTDRGDLLVGTAGYFTAAFLWGLNLPLTAALLQTFDPFWVSPLRYLIATVLLGTLVAVVHGMSGWRSPIALRRVMGLSLFVAGFLQLYNLGLAHAHPMTVAALSAGSPVYVAVVSRLMTGARLQAGFWGATALTLVGAGIAISGRARASAEAAGGAAGSTGWGGLGLEGGEPLIILSIASWTIYSILAQRWFAPEVSQLRRTYLSTIGAVPWLLGFWGIARLTGVVGPPELSPAPLPLTQLLIAALLCTATATVAWNTGVNRLGIQMGGIWQNLVPVFAVLLSLVLFDVEPLPEQIIGGAIVLVGVVYLQWRRLRG